MFTSTAQYAINMTSFMPTQLHHSLELNSSRPGSFAGQINGTTGYEEKPGDKLSLRGSMPTSDAMAGSVYPSRDRPYVGVLIDDLVTKGVDEPVSYVHITGRIQTCFDKTMPMCGLLKKQPKSDLPNRIGWIC